MPAPFCSECGARVLPAAKFCSQCGVALGAVSSGAQWRLTTAGTVVLSFFVMAGLAIWTAILTPAAPRPGPGGGPPRTTTASVGGELPADHPKVPVPLPEEAKRFINELAARAKERPDDVDTWARLGQVYYRAAQLDPAYYPEALAAFQHVLEKDAKHPDALRGVASVHYDREEHAAAIAAYERYLTVRPDDHAARTDLGTMQLYGGDRATAMATYRDVVRRAPTFMQAHFNLAVAHAQQGDRPAALGELREARRLAGDDGVRRQIDDMIARIEGAPGAGDVLGAGSPATPRSPFQSAVEQAFRQHPIMGPRIARFEWPSAGTGRVLVENFPMAAMPAEVREKFLARLADEIRKAQSANVVDGPVRMEIADASSGTLMATVTP